MLTPLIRLADAAYRAGMPLMPDAAFDALSRLAPDALPPLTTLLSIDCPPDPIDWLVRNPGPYTIQLKADGVSVNLVYLNGRFRHAHLRSGRDCTHAALRAGALLDLPGSPVGRVEIRCEAIALAETQPNYTPGDKQPTRNATAAALRRKGMKDHLRLTLLAFDITGIDAMATQEQSLTWLQCAGFATLAPLKVGTIADVLEHFEAFCLCRNQLPYACDGLVVKIDSKLMQRQLGCTPRTPRWAISLKP